MSLLEKFLAGAIGLSLAVILVQNGAAVNDIFRGFADFNEKTFRTLQGR